MRARKMEGGLMKGPLESTGLGHGQAPTVRTSQELRVEPSKGS